MASIPKPQWTPQTYLEFERTSDLKHEYIQGEIFAMAGASPEHNIIGGNTYASLHSQLRKRNCIVFPSDMRVRIPAFDVYTYPDISAVCGTPQFEASERDSLLNPVLIIEVLSSTTESYDRGKKFQYYRSIPTLQEYLLIAQDSYRIERFLRQSDNQWLLTDVATPDASLELPSIQCTLALSDIYEKVEFEGE